VPARRALGARFHEERAAPGGARQAFELD